jgi:cell division cycle 20-like protein 1 (cofactor of APC complex)
MKSIRIDESRDAYTQLLRREILGYKPVRNQNIEKTDQSRLLRSPERGRVLNCTVVADATEDQFPTSPVRFNGNSNPLHRTVVRKIPRVPYKVLDAPQLTDDFYLNLIDWSSTNVLAVGLSNCVYLWNASTSRVTKLCDLGSEDTVTSVGWAQRGTHLAVGTNRGELQIWDPSTNRKLRTMTGHQTRIGSVAWNGYMLATGSRDHSIMMRDVRIPEHYTEVLQGHRQEVCGLKWSMDETQLASGGNDNKLLIWNVANLRQASMKFSDHQAAVKAIAWSPHQHGLLASGGGTADRCIKFWNTLNSSCINSIDTGSQVCNLAWSRNVNEIVSTHGYSLNQVIVWKYSSGLSKLATLTGHTFRVLYLAVSPDGQNVVTGAGDETLRFWSVFPPAGGGTKASASTGNSLGLIGSLNILGSTIR